MAFATKEQLITRLEDITQSTSGIKADKIDTFLADILIESQNFILETLISKGWSKTTIDADWVAAKTTHLDIATYNYLVKYWLTKLKGRPELLKELKEVKDNLVKKEILLDSNGVVLSRGVSRQRIQSSSDGKGRSMKRRFDDEINEDDIQYDPPF